GLLGWRGPCKIPAQPFAAADASDPCGNATCVDGAQAIRRQWSNAPWSAHRPPDGAPLSLPWSVTTLLQHSSVTVRCVSMVRDSRVSQGAAKALAVLDVVQTSEILRVGFHRLDVEINKNRAIFLQDMVH